MHRALTGVQVLVTRTPEHAHWVAQFVWGLLIVTIEKEIGYRNIIFRCSFIGYFFLGFHIETIGNVFLFLTMIQKGKNINRQTRQSELYSRATPPHKSESLVFRCSFYYLLFIPWLLVSSIYSLYSFHTVWLKFKRND
jgi:hypothetical protein